MVVQILTFDDGDDVYPSVDGANTSLSFLMLIFTFLVVVQTFLHLTMVMMFTPVTVLQICLYLC
jgi:hypothetical protein